MGLKLPKSNLSKSKLIGRWQQFYDGLDRQEPLDSLMFNVSAPMQPPPVTEVSDSASNSDSESNISSEGELVGENGLPLDTTNPMLGHPGFPFTSLVSSLFSGASANPLPQNTGTSMSDLYAQAVQQQSALAHEGPTMGATASALPTMRNLFPSTIPTTDTSSRPPKPKSKKTLTHKATKDSKKTPSKKSTARKSVRFATSPLNGQPKVARQPTLPRNTVQQLPPPPTQQQNLENLMKFMQLSNTVAPPPQQQPVNPFGMLQFQQMQQQIQQQQQMQQQFQQQQQLQSQLLASIMEQPLTNPVLGASCAPANANPSRNLSDSGNHSGNLPPRSSLRSSRSSGSLPVNPGRNTLNSPNMRIAGASLPPLRSADVASDFGLRRPIKSGRFRSSCQEVKNEQPWPNCMLDDTLFPVAPEYDELSWGQFVAGATSCMLAQISPGAVGTETENQIRHLNRIASFACFSGFERMLEFHAAILRGIENGLLSWSDWSVLKDYHNRHLDSVRLLQVAPQDQKPKKLKDNFVPPEYMTLHSICYGFQDGRCTEEGQHIREGTNETVLHICGLCHLKSQKNEPSHGYKTCPLKRKTPKEPLF